MTAFDRFFPALPLALSIALSCPAAETLFVAAPLTQGGFTEGIEGPACDRDGNIYVVSFEHARNIGKVTPKGRASLFLQLAEGSAGNGIRFDPSGWMYVADYTGHNVLKVNTRSKTATVLAHESGMNQPNDIALAVDGTLYASDPNWKDGTGQLWRITRDGKTHREAADMGTSNGLDLSPDGRTLYVNESAQRNVWAFDVAADGSLSKKRLLMKVPDYGFDGMRCDVDGNLYITRHGKGTVIKVSAKGEVLREIDVLGSRPSNICFGGKDGRTAYVTEVDHKRLIQFRVDRPGLEWTRRQMRR
ncbi:MAG: SMP-30/gluconolactonase/LRE family protein [Verrucomicrobia bacterium]|nr:SMP-30/gluconolactonase/LRE family protein [Verrucomicrobiota bacterium]MBI3869385.1 SMP-30/gluconolactonase/LRE family protein [Verrucomicrobiota bacterium]